MSIADRSITGSTLIRPVRRVASERKGGTALGMFMRRECERRCWLMDEESRSKEEQMIMCQAIEAVETSVFFEK